jgi:hypothetical protein
VTATTTSAAKLGLLEQLGGEAVVMDGLDAMSVGEVGTEPDQTASAVPTSWHCPSAEGIAADMPQVDRLVGCRA